MAAYYKVNESTVGRWRKSGRIPAVPKPSGARWLYPKWLIEDGARRRDWWNTRGITTGGE